MADVTYDKDKGFQISDETLRLWQQTFPVVDIQIEIAYAHAWVRANPSRQKKQWARFLLNWLSRANKERSGDVKRVEKVLENSDAPPLPPEIAAPEAAQNRQRIALLKQLMSSREGAKVLLKLADEDPEKGVAIKQFLDEQIAAKPHREA